MGRKMNQEDFKPQDYLDAINDIILNGCTDGNCQITGPKKGLGTNGGCHCLREIKIYAKGYHEKRER